MNRAEQFWAKLYELKVRCRPAAKWAAQNQLFPVCCTFFTEVHPPCCRYASQTPGVLPGPTTSGWGSSFSSAGFFLRPSLPRSWENRTPQEKRGRDVGGSCSSFFSATQSERDDGGDGVQMTFGSFGKRCISFVKDTLERTLPEPFFKLNRMPSHWREKAQSSMGKKSGWGNKAVPPSSIDTFTFLFLFCSTWGLFCILCCFTLLHCQSGRP